jgi:hypothetical protein
MKKRFGSHQAVVCFAAIVACGGIANAQNAVYIGTDEFTTAPGTNVVFPFPPGSTTTVQLKGKPLKGYKTVDTTVQRTQIAHFSTVVGIHTANPDLATATISIMLTALSLTGNVTIGSASCVVDITLDPSNLANDTGTMTLTVTPGLVPVGGTFTSILNVYYEATFTGTGCPAPVFGSYTMVQGGGQGAEQGQWSSVAPAGAYLTVSAAATCIPDSPPSNGHCLNTAAQKANNHTGLAPGETDFYLTGPGIENGPTASHIVCAALTTPNTTCK